MTHFIESRADYIPFQQSGKEFIEGLDALHQPNQYLYADENGLKVVGKIRHLVERFFSFFGRINHTSIPNIEMTLAKLLYHGYSEGHTEHHGKQFKFVLEKVRNRTLNLHFSVPMKAMMSLLIEQAGNHLDETVRTKLQNSLINIHTVHSKKLRPLGKRTPLPHGMNLQFGLAHLVLGKAALDLGDVDLAKKHAQHAYNLRIPNMYELYENLNLYIDIVEHPIHFLKQSTSAHIKNPSDRPRVRRNQYIAIGEDFFAQGKYSSAVEAYFHALENMKEKKLADVISSRKFPAWADHYLEALGKYLPDQLIKAINEFEGQANRLYTVVCEAFHRHDNSSQYKQTDASKAIKIYELLEKHDPKNHMKHHLRSESLKSFLRELWSQGKLRSSSLDQQSYRTLPRLETRVLG